MYLYVLLYISVYSSINVHVSLNMPVHCVLQGVVTSACSLLEELAHINAMGFSDCVPVAVTRLSRVSGGGEVEEME